MCDFVRTLTVRKRSGPGLPDQELTVLLSQCGVGEEGVVVWDAALVLAYFLERHQEQLQLRRGIHVVELGAGVGTVGLVAEALGAKVTLTDLDRLLPVLAASVELNKSQARVEAVHWGDLNAVAALCARQPPDLVVLADCIYYESSVEQLAASLVSLCSYTRCPVLLSYEVRDEYADKKAVKENFLRRIASSFRVTRHPTCECHPDFATDDICVLRLDYIAE